ncbi:MAG: hypothetical protein AVO39_03345 [delta proteobacterium MLS_D]|jgi:acyl-CoA dehydrogenase|nr:MAG: hypothetical protein AVO39_03345 [delta proteobacterium MLS_D]
MISFTLSEHQRELQQKFRETGELRLRPVAAEIDRAAPGPLDRRFLDILGSEGLISLLVPEEYGGQHVDAITLAVIIEELGWASTDFAAVFQSTFHAVKTILVGGSPEQKKRFLKELLAPSGRVAAFCPTEEQGGSDSSSFRTTARLSGDRYILNGEKTPVINAGSAAFYIVWANMDTDRGRSGINAFVVPGDTPGVTCGPYYDKSGHRGVPIATVTFDNVEVPKENLIGAPGSGYLLLMQTVDSGRAFVGASCVGLARAALEIALEHAKKRTIKSRPIISNQGVSFSLADLLTHLEAARLLVWKACELMNAGLDHSAASAMAKLFASELAVHATSEGMLILGQKSMHRSALMEKFQRDAQLTRIVEGTSHIQKAVIASQL